MKYNLDTLIDEHPNVILQISGEDLRAFAHEILIGAKAIAKAEVEAAAKSDELLTIQEVSDLLEVSKMTLHRWDQNGILRKVWIGGKRRYRKSDIDQLVGTKLKSQQSRESRKEV